MFSGLERRFGESVVGGRRGGDYNSPDRIVGETHVTGVDFNVADSDEGMHLNADVVFKAIGQKMNGDGVDALDVKSGRFVVDDGMKTTLDGVWAGGDCVVGGDDLTVSAVQHGKIAAIDIDRTLRNA